MVESTTKRMTAEDYLQLPENSKLMALLDGVVHHYPSYYVSHQCVMSNLMQMLSVYSLKGDLFHGLLDVKFDDYNVTQPDILWIKPGGKCRVGGKFLEGAPDFVIEILSPGSVSDDKIKKFKLYERFGVAEYWIIDPTEAYVEVLVLVDGAYQLQDIYPPDAQFESSMLGKLVDLKRVFAK